MDHVEFACLFIRAVGDRLQAAERLVLAVPRLVGGAFAGCDLRHRSNPGFLRVTVRLREPVARAERDRLVFWTARSGGRAIELATLSAEDRERLDPCPGAPDAELLSLGAETLFDAAGRFFTEVGAPADRRRDPRGGLVMGLEVGGPGWEGVRWIAGSSQLMVNAPVSPPLGDAIPLLVRVPGEARPLPVATEVAEVRSTPSAGSPGFTLQLRDPPERLVEALDANALAEGNLKDARAAVPRLTVNPPVKVAPPGKPAATTPAAVARVQAAKLVKALIEYASDQELAADFTEHLSQGRAFIRCATPAPVGTPVELQLRLPAGGDLHIRATVASVNAGGMGVRFKLDAEVEGALAAALAQLSARPRRALVVDDDALQRRMLGDALRERGFEVLTASDAKGGLGTLAEELLGLDLLVTDVVMPGMDGEEFVRLIRKAGGETDLAIVAVSGHLEGGLEPKLEAAGADAVLDKALGPELIAQAVDAVLERRRMDAEG